MRELVGWICAFYIISKIHLPQSEKRKDRELDYFLFCFQKMVYFEMLACL